MAAKKDKAGAVNIDSEKALTPTRDEGESTGKKVDIDSMVSSLIKDINKEFGSRVAYNLSEMTAPTIVKRWLDTGSIQLNYAIKNAFGGGWPEGRIIEIAGIPSGGKSHLAYHAAANVQKLGGLVVYIDTENATPVQKLGAMGIDVRKRFVYCDSHCTEEVFTIIESTILKAKSVVDKDISILVIWDSVAATSPRAELDGEYDQNTIGLQARTISKGMRKLTGVIGQNNVTLLCINQLRDAIGVTHGDPTTTPGGKAIPYHSSIRIRLTSGTQVKDSKGNVIGIHVIATVKKNKVAAPFRKCEFDIIFGKGIVEDEYLFDECRAWCEQSKDFLGAVWEEKQPGGKVRKLSAKITGSSAWKELMVVDGDGVVVAEKKFYKNDFGKLMKDETYGPYVMKVVDGALTVDYGDSTAAEVGEEPEDDGGDDAV
jgi:recombination protein RecA